MSDRQDDTMMPEVGTPQETILIVEDSMIQAELLRRVLAKAGYRVTLAKDGAEGLATARKAPPRLIISDITMPVMDGFEMCRAIRQDAALKDLPVILLTMLAEASVVINGLKAGADYYVTKPFNAPYLLSRIKTILKEPPKCGEEEMEMELTLDEEKHRVRVGPQRILNLLVSTYENAVLQNRELMSTQDQLEKTSQSLKEKAQKLEASYDDLKQAEAQLLQQDKMASIGQLAAGVAHEINNPIGFVNSNLSTMQRYIDGLFKLLSAYEASEGELLEATRAAVADLKQQIDISFLREDVAGLLTESMDGMQRVKRIVQNLMDFSQVNSSEIQWANLEHSLDSAINVAWDDLKHKAEVIKEYGGIPEIECLPAQLNQVFMNLLINAAQSIDEHGEIRIATSTDAGSVRIAISDTGCGIPPENLKRIFEPFFTTKDVGKGTGLGLAIAYGIVVNEHGGRIDVTSEVGAGTTVTIFLPIKREQSPMNGETAA
jgi:signal transduction histidine kinase